MKMTKFQHPHEAVGEPRLTRFMVPRHVDCLRGRIPGIPKLPCYCLPRLVICQDISGLHLDSCYQKLQLIPYFCPFPKFFSGRCCLKANTLDRDSEDLSFIPSSLCGCWWPLATYFTSQAVSTQADMCSLSHATTATNSLGCHKLHTWHVKPYIALLICSTTAKLATWISR